MQPLKSRQILAVALAVFLVGLGVAFAVTSRRPIRTAPAESQTVTLEIAREDAPVRPLIHVEGWNVAEKILQ